MTGRPELAPLTGWFPDPVGRYELRWYNGTAWTPDVSVHGQRYVDPLGTAPGAQNWATFRPPGKPARHPARIPAVLSLVFALVGLALAWMPFLFVIGGAGAIAGLVLGIVALSRSRSGGATATATATVTPSRVAGGLPVEAAGGPPSGRGLAIAGVSIAPVALGLCVVGALLSVTTIREFEAFLEPGPHRVEVDACRLVGTRATFTGSLTNGSDETRSYVVQLRYLDGIRTVERGYVELTDVAPGRTVSWEDGGFVGSDVDLDCRIDDVTGPFPFGIPIETT